MEGIWETERGASSTVIGLPDEESRETDHALKIPYAASLILTHDLDGEAKGLNEFETHPLIGLILRGVAITLPLIAAYSVFVYRVFGGKATELRYD